MVLALLVYLYILDCERIERGPIRGFVDRMDGYPSLPRGSCPTDSPNSTLQCWRRVNACVEKARFNDNFMDARSPFNFNIEKEPFRFLAWEEGRPGQIMRSLRTTKS